MIADIMTKALDRNKHVKLSIDLRLLPPTGLRGGVGSVIPVEGHITSMLSEVHQNITNDILCQSWETPALSFTRSVTNEFDYNTCYYECESINSKDTLLRENNFRPQAPKSVSDDEHSSEMSFDEKILVNRQTIDNCYLEIDNKLKAIKAKDNVFTFMAERWHFPKKRKMRTKWVNSKRVHFPPPSPNLVFQAERWNFPKKIKVHLNSKYKRKKPKKCT